MAKTFEIKPCGLEYAFLAKSWRKKNEKIADKKSWPIGGDKSPYTRQKYFSSFITRKFGQDWEAEKRAETVQKLSVSGPSLGSKTFHN